MKNPFIFGSPVPPPQFYGRNNTVHFMMDRLFGYSRSSIALWGDRRVGKTSLLYFLMQEELRLDYVEDLEKHHIIFIDCQIFTTNFTQHLFWLEVLEQLSETAVSATIIDEIERLLGKPKLQSRDVRRLLRKMQNAGESLTLLLDEFSHIVWAGQHSDAQEMRAFLSFLRTGITAVMPSSKTTHPRPLAIVTSSRRPLNEVTLPIYGSADIGSPFHNAFVFERLQPFSEKTVNHLLDSKLDGSPLAFTAPEKQHLITQTGRHPILVQSYGSELFLAKEKTKTEITDFGTIDNEFYDRSQHHFQGLWHYSSEPEQNLMAQLAKETADLTDPAIENPHRQLLERGILLPSNQFFSPLFQQWLRLNLNRLLLEQKNSEPLPEGPILLQLLDQYFNENDLLELMFELGVDEENIAGDTKRAKMRELIQWAQLRANVPRLVKVMKEKRPFLDI